MVGHAFSRSVGCLFTILLSAAMQLSVWDLECETIPAIPDQRNHSSDSQFYYQSRTDSIWQLIGWIISYREVISFKACAIISDNEIWRYQLVV